MAISKELAWQKKQSSMRNKRMADMADSWLSVEE